MLIDDPAIDPILEQYNDQLLALILSANNGELTRSQFRNQLDVLVTTFLTLAFLTAGGDIGNRSELDQLIEGHTEGVNRLTRDVYAGTYQGEENEDRLQSRVNTWVIAIAGAYAVGQEANTRQDERLVWRLGVADHCSTCLALDGVVLTRAEWESSGYRPQGRNLECGGYNCKCSRLLTDSESIGLENLPV